MGSCQLACKIVLCDGETFYLSSVTPPHSHSYGKELVLPPSAGVQPQLIQGIRRRDG